MKRWKWLTAALALVFTLGAVGYGVTDAAEGQGQEAPPRAGAMRRAYWRALGIRTTKLQLKVVDAFTQKGIPGAGCVIGETGDRVETNANGVAPVIDAPVFRHPRLEQMLAEIHGALTILCYKNGYRDAIYMGLRMYENVTAMPEIWMTPFGRRDRRIEPTLYHQGVHRIWQIQLADKYRLLDQGEGPERPALSNPEAGPAPAIPMGREPQTPLRTDPPPPTNVIDMIPPANYSPNGD